MVGTHSLLYKLRRHINRDAAKSFTQASIGNCMLTFPFLTNILNYKKDSLRIGYYHMISSQPRECNFDRKKVSPQVFEKQLSYFSKHFDIISLSEALQIAERKGSFQRKMVLTFDDGFAENYSVAAPILKAKKIPATFFLIGNCIDNKDLMWRNKLLVIRKRAGERLSKITAEATAIFGLPPMLYYEDILSWSLRAWPMHNKDEIANYCWQAARIGTVQEYLEQNQPYLSVQQIRSLLNDGFEIGSHSMSHPVFSRLSYEQIEHEIFASVQLLQTTFGKTITSFSYPFGIKPARELEQKLLKRDRLGIKTLLGSKNTMDNYENSFAWERDNFEFPLNEVLFRLNIMPLLRRLHKSAAEPEEQHRQRTTAIPARG
jgi:peptidoglycan/xylan/chitin deacetylase (PgdA/CDA1 family)